MSATFYASTLFSGIGGGALGLQEAGFGLCGAIDSDPAAAADYEHLTGSPCTVADLQTMSVQEFRAAHTRRPDFLLTSPPCKAFSGCLPLDMSRTPKYREMSSLAQRGIMLALEAWVDNPVPLIALENVPRIMSRGREWLDQIVAMLHAYGYACRETTHDCGELGGLAQHRRRFLLVARHMATCPEFLYVPPVRRVRGVGEVLASLPVPAPGSTDGGPMHRRPRLSALNALRLALIPAGGDWRDLPDHVAVACSPRSGVYGVLDAASPSPTITGAANHDNGTFAVADPRIDRPRREGSLGVKGWEDASTAIIAHAIPQNHPCSVADPRLDHAPRKGGHRVGAWGEPSGTVIGEARIDKGFSVNDPSPLVPTHWIEERAGTPVLCGPHVDLSDAAPTDMVIRALDGTNHRPLTTLELAVLQGFDPWRNGDWLQLTGRSHQAWRQRIGNAIPPPAAEAIGRSALATLSASREGSYLMSAAPVWVSPRTEEASR